MKKAWPVAALAVACGTPDTPDLHRDEAEVARLVDVLEPSALVALVQSPDDALELDGACRVEVSLGADAALALAEDPTLDEDSLLVDTSEQLYPSGTPGNATVWAGPCVLPDGAQLHGELRLERTPQGTWLSAEDFEIAELDAISGDYVPAVQLSGSVELVRQGDLLRLDAGLRGCGVASVPCTEGELSLDLSWSVFPADGLPDAYRATVSGALGEGDQVTGVEGTWQLDADVCGTEAISGEVALGAFPRQVLAFDGATHCDACADWTVQGQDVAPLCGGGF